MRVGASNVCKRRQGLVSDDIWLVSRCCCSIRAGYSYKETCFALIRRYTLKVLLGVAFTDMVCICHLWVIVVGFGMLSSKNKLCHPMIKPSVLQKLSLTSILLDSAVVNNVDHR